MVVQGVKNPLVDLLSLEDKTLDEVRFPEMTSQSQPQHTDQKSFTCTAFFWPEDLNYFLWCRVMESAQHYPPLPLQTGLWRRAVTQPLSSASTITAPWCWQQAHAKGKENTFWNLLPVFSGVFVFFFFADQSIFSKGNTNRPSEWDEQYRRKLAGFGLLSASCKEGTTAL